MSSAYEVNNPSFSDMNLEQQIQAGVNDWLAEDMAAVNALIRARMASEHAPRIPEVTAHLCRFSPETTA